MANPYEVEHNIKTTSKARTRRPSMSSFFNQLSQIETTTLSSTHNNVNSTPTPVDVAAAERLLQEQYRALLSTTADSEDARNTALLESLITDLETLIDQPPTEVNGVPRSYLDELERVPKKILKKNDTCPICNEAFLDDKYPLVVELPCHRTHRFDLECVGPWLRLQGTCPLDRKRMIKEKVEPVKDEEDEDDYDEMFA
ncbi:uncharacterized protein RSE6_06261 [Rhynchosporium secalis]|uniref:RING-type domain-containing protein n=1 Tax=Rhynchosporium secalis TaxID=38038 RepID=A0A1E1MA13_RHYSE|nr:uncharacterized protein RSE6_06261 [Rhynchosporium secalis]